jgi:hypothetical protein
MENVTAKTSETVAKIQQSSTPQLIENQQVKNTISKTSSFTDEQTTERLIELENKMKTKGLGPDEIKEREQLMAIKGKQIKKEC